MKSSSFCTRRPLSSFEQMMRARQQQKAGIAVAPGSKAAAVIVESRAPLGQDLRVTRTGSAPFTNDLVGYSILQGESKEALALRARGTRLHVPLWQYRSSGSCPCRAWSGDRSFFLRFQLTRLDGACD